MLISKLSKRTGLSIYTLRYYENDGLFSGTANEKVKTNNNKHYPESLIEKIELIKEAKEIGFTLSEIKTFLDSWYSKRLSVIIILQILFYGAFHHNTACWLIDRSGRKQLPYSSLPRTHHDVLP